MTDALATVNASGYPFQIAVEQVVRTRCRGAWTVEAVELPWSEGFVDLVLRSGPLAAVVECKRVKEQTWYFLTQDAEGENTSRARLEWYNGRLAIPKKGEPASARLMCAEYWMSEGSHEATFCVLPKGSKSRTEILEDVARPLVRAAREIIGRERYEDGNGYEIAVPVIVTNATLKVLTVDPRAIVPAEGTIPVTAASVQDAGFVRFRKTMVNYHSAFNIQYGAVAKLAEDRERTVFVVNVNALERFLFGFRAYGPHGRANGSTPVEYDEPSRVTTVFFR